MELWMRRGKGVRIGELGRKKWWVLGGFFVWELDRGSYWKCWGWWGGLGLKGLGWGEDC